jgi:epsilon-lactone hydrolase
VASPQLQPIVDLLRQVMPPDASLEESRATMEMAARAFRAAPDTTVTPVTVGGVPAEWLTTAESTDQRVVYYLHGGAYTSGSPRTHRALAERLARATAARILLLDYRLAPEHPFPAAVDDAVAAWRALVGDGADPASVVMAGDSAGGGLTLATLVALRDAGDPLPAAAVTLSAWTDLAHTGDSMATKAGVDPMITPDHSNRSAEAYLAGADARHPLASPLYADPRGLSPLLMQVGTSEVLLDDTVRFARRAEAAGVDVTLEVWDDMIHVFQAFGGFLPEAGQAVDRIGQWVGQRLC